MLTDKCNSAESKLKTLNTDNDKLKKDLEARTREREQLKQEKVQLENNL